MNDRRDPYFDDNWTVFDEMVEFVTTLVGDSGRCRLRYVDNGTTGLFDVSPHNPRARPIEIMAEQFFVVTVGDNGGRWELDYTDSDVALMRRIVAAAVAGCIDQRFAFGRSIVTVTFDDLTTLSERGVDGCASLFVPQPGWTRWGRLETYEPYVAR